jgi:RHS repeat-associated protein
VNGFLINAEVDFPETCTTGYRFSFNGQEKDDEVAGNGNTNTAEFWEYDTRLGRRFNLDPITRPQFSSYSCSFNNPIVFADPSGAGAEVTAEKDKKGQVTGIAVTAKFYVHGNDADKVANEIKNDVNNHLCNVQGTWGHSREVPVTFNITVEVVNDEQFAQAQSDQAKDKSINICETTTSNSEYLGQGSFLFNSQTLHSTGNEFTHELFHMLGFWNGVDKKNVASESPLEPTHLSSGHTLDNNQANPLPVMWVGKIGNMSMDAIFKIRALTSTDIQGLVGGKGLNFNSVNAVKYIIEYPSPVSSDRYSNGCTIIKGKNK